MKTKSVFIALLAILALVFAGCDTFSNNVAVTRVTLNTTTISLNVGGTQMLTPNVEPENATNRFVTWTSSNPEIATVSAAGLVTGIAAGTATITVTTRDGGKTAAADVTVIAAPSTDIAVSSTDPALNGTWVYMFESQISQTLIFNNGNFDEIIEGDIPSTRGTFTTSNHELVIRELVMTVEYIHGGIFRGGYGFENRWYTRAEAVTRARTAGNDDLEDRFNQMFLPHRVQYAISGNRLMLIDDFGTHTWFRN